MFSKKGQSALEYLMTYGWALVVIVIVIAALVFLINPGSIGGSQCSPSSGILITNHQVDPATDNLKLILSNQTGGTLPTVDVNVTGTVGGTVVTASPSNPAQISNVTTTSYTATIPLTGGEAGQYSLTINFGYSDKDGIPRVVPTTCNGNS